MFSTSINKLAQRLMSLLKDKLKEASMTLKNARIAVKAAKEINNAVDRLLGHLRARRVVEINAALTLVSSGQRRKLRADGLDWKVH